ncbi:hypothetical protein [Actinomadura sp. WMMB 499]|uniref:hypothetical protein n=1 Tax=Actinomadura sp. WMMB 499 TaxID=1219491 RepID=UPI0012476D14|nr:hypothetical protein [Actinomadura sp. WMMB 499]QFG24713.1 hypothetical protein F7P10_29790 [Actinomadura sp. WMMB 499]
MNRRRLIPLGLLVVLLVAPMVWPAALACTFVFGDKATATVTACERGPTRTGSEIKSCRGTWRTDGGERGAGEIYGVLAHQEGDTLRIRIGLAGPYANGWARGWPFLIWTVPGPLGVLGFVRFRRAILRRGRGLAASLLAEPGALVVSRDAVRRPGGSAYASLRAAEHPGGPRLDLPGRRPQVHRPPWDDRDAPEVHVEAVADAAGRPLMFLEHRTGSRFEPETAVLAPSGVPLLLVRRESPHPLAYRLLDPSGAELGSARTASGIGTLAVRDAAGNRFASAGLRGRDWVLRADETAPEPLRDAALALVLAQFHHDN